MDKKAVDSKSQSEVGIAVRAKQVIDNGDGTFVIVVQGRRPTEDEQRVLKTLFPTTSELAYGLIHKEALLAAMVD
jgi:hypothetical protein